MFDADYFDGKTYKLANILDHNGRSKMEGGRDDQERYQYWAGYYTNDIRVVTREYLGESYKCLSVNFVADADGNYANRHLRTSPILKIEEGIGRVIVHTANSVYAFVEWSLPEPEVRKANNLLELWLGKGDHRFGKGVLYDADGTPHVLTLTVHLGAMRDSFLICHRDSPSITVSRYFKGYRRIEFYDTIYGQQDYTTPMLVHNTADYPLTIKFQFSDVEYRIAPGGGLLIHPPEGGDNREHHGRI